MSRCLNLLYWGQLVGELLYLSSLLLLLRDHVLLGQRHGSLHVLGVADQLSWEEIIFQSIPNCESQLTESTLVLLAGVFCAADSLLDIMKLVNSSWQETGGQYDIWFLIKYLIYFPSSLPQNSFFDNRLSDIKTWHEWDQSFNVYIKYILWFILYHLRQTPISVSDFCPLKWLVRVFSFPSKY